MAATLLAAASDALAGGGAIAGLPVGDALSWLEAFQALRLPRGTTGVEWGTLVRAASSHQRHRPAISIWHGASERTVNAGDAVAL